MDIVRDDDEYETVAGLLMRAAGRVPGVGFAHQQQGVEFEVCEADATRVLQVKVRCDATVQAPETDEAEPLQSTG